MAIERTDLSSGLSVNEMAPVASTPAAQNRSAPDLGQSKPQRREPAPQKEKNKNKDKDKDKEQNSMESPAEKAEAEEDHEGDTGRPPHRIDNLA